MKRTYYMHTLDGKPAGYDASISYIYFTNHVGTREMAKSLRELRKQQAADSREKRDRTFGYVRITIEA